MIYQNTQNFLKIIMIILTCAVAGQAAFAQTRIESTVRVELTPQDSNALLAALSLSSSDYNPGYRSFSTQEQSAGSGAVIDCSTTTDGTLTLCTIVIGKSNEYTQVQYIDSRTVGAVLNMDDSAYLRSLFNSKDKDGGSAFFTSDKSVYVICPKINQSCFIAVRVQQ